MLLGCPRIAYYKHFLKWSVYSRLATVRTSLTYSPLKKGEENWVELTFSKTAGTVARDSSWPSSPQQQSQKQLRDDWLSAPVLFSFLKWRMSYPISYTTESSSVMRSSAIPRNVPKWLDFSQYIFSDAANAIKAGEDGENMFSNLSTF